MPNNCLSLLNDAIRFFENNDLKSSKQILLRILNSDQDNLPAIHILGLIEVNMKNYQEAIKLFSKGIILEPNDASLHFNLAKALYDSNEFVDSIKYFESSLSLNSQNPDTWLNYSQCLIKLNKDLEALSLLDNLILKFPNFEKAQLNKGVLLSTLNRYHDSLIIYDSLIAANPQYSDAYINKGFVLKVLNRFEEALECYQIATKLNPLSISAWINLGNTQQELSLIDDAAQSYREALKIDGSSLLARWGLAFSNIPPIFRSAKQSDSLYRKFCDQIQFLYAEFKKLSCLDAHLVVGSSQPFYLAYINRNHKPILSEYGKLCSMIMSSRFQDLSTLNSPTFCSDKVKVGFVVDKIKHHSVWNAITSGLIKKLNKSKFEIHLFYLGHIENVGIDLAELGVSFFVHNQRSLADWVFIIKDCNLDVLIYPEIGMNQLTAQLACLRLSPLQICSWGHPVSCGLPTIDYFISSELFEPDDGSLHYSETLIQLPNLGCFYKRIPILECSIDINELGIDINVPILICPGTLFKYAPEYDYVYVEIAKRLGKCQFVFFNQHNSWSCVFKERLSRAFAISGLDHENFILFIPWLPQDKFYSLMRQADVYLDSIGFSGFNTAIQALECGLPVISHHGKYMRGRLASGILKRIGVNELVANSELEFINLTVKLINDNNFYNLIKEKISNGLHLVYEDDDAIEFLESFLIKNTNG
jgi:predicted O-linked N-acetylglucosamine transferase (SPINDLY family)